MTGRTQTRCGEGHGPLRWVRSPTVRTPLSLHRRYAATRLPVRARGGPCTLRPRGSCLLAPAPSALDRCAHAVSAMVCARTVPQARRHRRASKK
ncbi:hypothetical protein B0H10DRAFT_1992932 [Mycena sp. CBHHK59/15]|nr:hypothetical protein B0H10DRAFT_1992932 [Mycena sp. CBHHK59/15]